MKLSTLSLKAASALFVIVFSAHAASPIINWPQFRGPCALGVADNPNLPERWSTNENVAWKIVNGGCASRTNSVTMLPVNSFTAATILIVALWSLLSRFRRTDVAGEIINKILI